MRKYDNICPKCRRPVLIGGAIDLTRGGGIYHISCEAAPPLVPDTRPATEGKRDALRRMAGRLSRAGLGAEAAEVSLAAERGDLTRADVSALVERHIAASSAQMAAEGDL